MEDTNQYEENLIKFLDEIPEYEIDKEYFEIQKEYKKLFGHIPPREMMPSNITDDQIKEAMKTCIQLKQDKLLELLHVKINDNYIY